MDIMKMLAELYLEQLGIDAKIETIPIEPNEEQGTITNKIA